MRRCAGLVILALLAITGQAHASGGVDGCIGTPQKLGYYFDCSISSTAQETYHAYQVALAPQGDDTAGAGEAWISNHVGNVKNVASNLVQKNDDAVRANAKKGQRITGGGKMPWSAGKKIGDWLRSHYGGGQIRNRAIAGAKDCAYWGAAMFAIAHTEGSDHKAALIAAANGCAGGFLKAFQP